MGEAKTWMQILTLTKCDETAQIAKFICFALYYFNVQGEPGQGKLAEWPSPL